MTETELPKAYVNYPKTKELLDLLMSKRVNEGIRITTIHNGREKIIEMKRKPNMRLINHLIDNFGSKTKTLEETRYSGKINVLGVPGTYSGIGKDPNSGQTIIRVRVVANDVGELFKNVSALKGQLNVGGLRETQCTWDNLGTVEIDPEELAPYKHIPKPKMNPPIVDKTDIQQRRLTDLEAYREEYIH